ncbi:MAG: hypothetical protein CMK09_07305 [Ponticaulis sp.]|nr:hypothetical protein [Ponticaulis sp.]|tara:strand:+ start:10232 stop:10495 length:264 start_codon:yes stop_codon:yes gene_type:complete
MKKFDDKTVDMFDQMRARRRRIMKRLAGRAGGASGSGGIRTQSSNAADATSEAGNGASSSLFDPTLMIYLLVFSAIFGVPIFVSIFF